MAETMLIRCVACGSMNRVPQERLATGRTAVCGQCKTALPLSAKPIAVTDSDFANQVENSPLPVLIDMWADWCGPCHAIAPVIDQIAAEMNGRVRVVKMSVDHNPATASRLRIQSIPALVIYKDGREVDRLVGVQPKAEIVRRLERVMS